MVKWYGTRATEKALDQLAEELMKRRLVEVTAPAPVASWWPTRELAELMGRGNDD